MHSKLQKYQVFLNSLEDLYFSLYWFIARCKLMVEINFFNINYHQYGCSFGIRQFPVVILIFIPVDYLNKGKNF